MLVLNNSNLINGTGREPIDKTSITIEGNRISSVKLHNDNPDVAASINLAGLVVMPGLIDCHLHLSGIIKDNPMQTTGKISFIDMVPLFGTTFVITLVKDS